MISFKRFSMPRLRLYQQIVIIFVLIVLLPLLGVSFVIYNINQEALRREIERFNEHTAKALYKDFGTEMSWQRQETQSLSQVVTTNMRNGETLEAAAQDAFRFSSDLDAIALYDKNGHAIRVVYKDIANVSPELRLPDDLGLRPLEQPFRVVYYNTGAIEDSPYYLRSIVPISGISLAGVPEPGEPVGARGAAYYVQQKSFDYLQNLVRAQSLYDAFYIVDPDGFIIAGPTGAAKQQRITDEDYREFRDIKPGVTHQYSSQQTGNTGNIEDQNAHGKLKKDDNKDDEPAELKKVIVKMPDVNWGIIIESPYHVKQRYIKRASTQTILLIGGCLIVIIILALVYVLSVSRNFRQLIKGIQAMGEGNYFRRIRLLSNFFTPYEIIYLTMEFNRMAKRTADSWAAIQEANRQLAKMDEFKSNLIDTVSHELRTPLTSIKGYTNRLLRHDKEFDSETRIKNLKVVKQQADRLSRLVEDLLVIPDLESFNLRVYPDEVPLTPLIEGSVQFIQAKEHREIFLKMDADPEVSVLADPDRLEQILLNLLDNAVKYSIPETPIRIDVSLPSEKSGNSPSLITIVVVNSCEPIPMEELGSLDKLFDKFQRLDDSLVRTTRGSGLGLFITRGLVEAMGGEIHLESVGSEFRAWFTVPLYTVSEEGREHVGEIASAQ